MRDSPANTPTFEQFQTLASIAPAAGSGHAIPIYRTLLADHLTPVTAFERLAGEAGGKGHAFLLASVVGGERIARFSFLGANPRTVIRALGRDVSVENAGGKTIAFESADPLRDLEHLLKPIKGQRHAAPSPLPSFTGGAVGYAAYDTVRYLEPEKLPNVPKDDRILPDLLFGIYDDLVIFDHVQKTVLVVANAHVGKAGDNRTYRDIYNGAVARINAVIHALSQPIAF